MVYIILFNDLRYIREMQVRILTILTIFIYIVIAHKNIYINKMGSTLEFDIYNSIIKGSYAKNNDERYNFIGFVTYNNTIGIIDRFTIKNINVKTSDISDTCFYINIRNNYIIVNTYLNINTGDIKSELISTNIFHI